jgi:hypothetical protein
MSFGGMGSTTPKSSKVSLANFQKTVTAAGTAEILFAATETKKIWIKALSGNTNNVYVGTSTVDSSNGLVLAPGEGVVLDVDHSTTNIYIDVDTNGEGVSGAYNY